MMTIRGYRNDKVGNDAWEHVGTLVSQDLGLIAKFQPDYFTAVDLWANGPKRITGKYEFQGATAELTASPLHKTQPDSLEYRLEMKFADIACGQKLHSLIRAGQILPAVSYEEKQVDTLPRQLRDLCREFFYILRLRASAFTRAIDEKRTCQ